MILDITCTYCGHKRKLKIWNKSEAEGLRCFICGDRNLEVKDSNTSKIDYYQGSPPFEEKSTTHGVDKDNDPWRYD